MPEPIKQPDSVAHNHLELMLQRQGEVLRARKEKEIAKLGYRPESPVRVLSEKYASHLRQSICTEGVELLVDDGQEGVVLRGVPYHIDEKEFVLLPYRKEADKEWTHYALRVPLEVISMQTKLPLGETVGRNAHPTHERGGNVA